MSFWSATETAAMREHYPRGGSAAYIAATGSTRTPDQVRAKADRMGLRCQFDIKSEAGRQNARSPWRLGPTVNSTRAAQAFAKGRGNG